jgi:hypothetical protein
MTTASRSRTRPAALPLCGLLALALGLAVAGATLPPHLHHGATAGLYNEEHVLLSLDSVSGDAPLPDPVASVSAVLPAGPSVLGARAEARSSAPRHADPRAPPAAL